MSFAELRDIGNVNEAKVWFNPSLRSQKSGNNIGLFADRFGYLLSDLTEEYVTPEILQILEQTKTILLEKDTDLQLIMLS